MRTVLVIWQNPGDLEPDADILTTELSEQEIENYYKIQNLEVYSIGPVPKAAVLKKKTIWELDGVPSVEEEEDQK